MATVIADNIISPLGFNTRDNYTAIKSGKSALSRYDTFHGVPFAFTASLFNQRQIAELQIDGYTRFESLAIQSIRNAYASCKIDISKAGLIISSTKGNVDLLSESDNPDQVKYLGSSAKRIANAVGVNTQPIVVCNACISGVSALILAERLIESKAFNQIIVCGIDIQSPFIISGFESLKALSLQECRPFDIERIGLNLGEAAATMILCDKSDNNLWSIQNGAVKNDAYHISSPQPQGDGCKRAIEVAVNGTDIFELAQINAHGTATMYNDQMESKAISRSGLSDIPTNALKGYFGHTMGASGVMETILTMHALNEGIVLATRGFDTIGVSGKVTISSNPIATDKKKFLKIISGFGGCNGAILLSKENRNKIHPSEAATQITHRVHITASEVTVDRTNIPISESETKRLTWLYKQYSCNYPKFYKMDNLSKLGFIASELLMIAEGKPRDTDDYNRGIVFFNRTGSYLADKAYWESIKDKDNFYPSPSLFVYTLPNIVTGEIAIRNKYYGETAFYILPERNQQTIDSIINSTFADKSTTSLITGWIDYESDTNFEADIYIIEKKSN